MQKQKIFNRGFRRGFLDTDLGPRFRGDDNINTDFASQKRFLEPLFGRDENLLFDTSIKAAFHSRP